MNNLDSDNIHILLHEMVRDIMSACVILLIFGVGTHLCFG
jgi:hypothetical protein